MNTNIAVLVCAFLVFLSAHVADAQQPAASLRLTRQSLEVGSTKDFDDACRVATDSGAQAFNQRDHPIISNERKRVTVLALKNRLEASCLTGRTPSTYTGVVKSIYPIEKVGVIARSVTFPQVLNQGQAIIDTEYPNASILCLAVANYSGLVTGLIWSMDRELVEEHGLQHLIDWASMAEFTCVRMFMSPELLNNKLDQQIGQGLPEEHATTQDNVVVQVANPDAVIAASPEIEEKTPAVSMEDAKNAVIAQIEKMQSLIRFAKTVKSMQDDD
jgi:uncharacterized membrane protein YjfL (UPF0719 family)